MQTLQQLTLLLVALLQELFHKRLQQLLLLRVQLLLTAKQLQRLVVLM